ncbi:BMN1 family protein, truncated [Babesia microti strain RI]|uniref:BMN1 family protein n=1 Tax=Babesia microti (strain RI) TaxID=1133968 RepID=A0A0K3AM01_BABMR|nr:BMN1 family protein, truncated [Babesia microti strain RI]XP_021337221.1 BMN1 family protein [Babesia microti strain RI]CTQ40596.1 BMN1 family protein [Babesia microti strain RI]CTQ41566.1 BMN1 family protein, truncated [Babesia microti strain RI]|eukprot:XP_012649577.1 BMN1 family protein, truncated [Babesia microti strain RI]
MTISDAAKDFEYEYKKRKADTLCDVSLAFNSLVQSLAIKFGANVLKNKIFNKDGINNTNFKDMIKEVILATEEVNKVLASGFLTLDILVFFKSFISTIPKVSNSIIPGFKALIVFVYLIWI